MRYEKAEMILRIALDMQGSAEGLSIQDIQSGYTDQPLSRRTAERLREAVERLFPQCEEVGPGERPKRWRIRSNCPSALAGITAEDLSDLRTAAALMRRENMNVHADALGRLEGKLRASLKQQILARIEPDLESLSEAEGIAMRPGPRPKIDPEIFGTLRDAIKKCERVRIVYKAQGTGRVSRQLVEPYGFLYGVRNYLIAHSCGTNGLRLWVLSNIREAKLAGAAFIRDPDFSLQEYAEASFGVFQEPPIDVTWAFDRLAAPLAREFLFHPTQRLEPQPDGSLLVHLRAGGRLEMAWHLRMWGQHVRIIRPSDFSERVTAAERRLFRERPDADTQQHYRAEREGAIHVD